VGSGPRARPTEVEAIAHEAPLTPQVMMVRWSARILSLLVLAFVGMFLVGEGFAPWTLRTHELLLALCFPYGVALGLCLGWKLELVGGAIVVASILGFYAIERFRCGPIFALFAVPGALFILAHVLSVAGRQHP